jgi:hypothetical protein
MTFFLGPLKKIQGAPNRAHQDFNPPLMMNVKNNSRRFNEKVIKNFLRGNFQFLADFAVLLEEVDSHLALPNTININN